MQRVTTSVAGSQVQRSGPAQLGRAAALHAHRAAAARRRCPTRPRPPPRPAAAAGATPAPQPPPAAAARARPAWLPGRESAALLTNCWRLLRANLAAVIVIHAIKEAAVFVLHRVTQRATNAVAEGALGVQLPPFVNPWYLLLDPRFAEFNWSYQLIVALFFIISLPINILSNAAASSTAALVVTGRHKGPGEQGGGGKGSGSGSSGSSGSTSGSSSSSSSGSSSASASGSAGAATATAEGASRPGLASYSSRAGAGRVGQSSFASAAAVWARPRSAAPGRAAPPAPRTGPLAQLRAGLSEARLGWRAAAPSLRRVWMADLLFNAWSLPLQAASLLVAPVFWTFPRLLSIQLAVPAAILSGAAPTAALDRSRALMAGRAAAYAWPYLLLTLASRGVDAVKQALLLAVPERWWQEVIEVPIAVTVAFTVAKVLVLRMQDLLPLATYLRLSQQEQQQEEQRQQQQEQGAAAAAAAEGGSGI